MQKEIFKDVPNYEGIYQVSNLGNLKSLSREIVKSTCRFISKEKILKGEISKIGYKSVKLYKDNKTKHFTVHQLVAITFLSHTPCKYKLVVDHINDNPLDNRVCNLQLITQRENCHKTQGRYSSKFKGVYFNKDSKKWLASIYINGKSKHLGLFTNEEEASNAYQNELLKLKTS